MVNNKNLLEHGRATQFPHNDPTKGGRKKMIYTILKEKGYSKDDISIAFLEIAFYTVREAEELGENSELPIITRIIANQFLQAHKKGDWSKISEILKHSIGMSSKKVSTEHSGSLAMIPSAFYIN